MIPIPLRPAPAAVVLAALVLLVQPAAGAEGAHVHGAVHLDVAIDARSLVIEIEAPLDSLLGFERAPRSAAEKQAAQAMLARFEQAHNLFMPDAAAACTFKSASAASAALQPGAKAGEHADLDGRFEWDCSNAAAARSIDIGPLLDAFKRIQAVEVQIAGPAGQFKLGLKRPQRVLRWGR